MVYDWELQITKDWSTNTTRNYIWVNYPRSYPDGMAGACEYERQLVVSSTAGLVDYLKPAL